MVTSLSQVWTRGGEEDEFADDADTDSPDDELDEDELDEDDETFSEEEM